MMFISYTFCHIPLLLVLTVVRQLNWARRCLELAVKQISFCPFPSTPTNVHTLGINNPKKKSVTEAEESQAHTRTHTTLPMYCTRRSLAYISTNYQVQSTLLAGFWVAQKQPKIEAVNHLPRIHTLTSSLLSRFKTAFPVQDLDFPTGQLDTFLFSQPNRKFSFAIARICTYVPVTRKHFLPLRLHVVEWNC